MNNLARLCRTIATGMMTSQRQLASTMDLSVGSVNKLVKEATDKGFLTQLNKIYELTPPGWEWMEQFKVDNAIILAAGFGSRFVPFTYETPKGLVKVNGTPMIEHQIEQLLEVGVTEIVIVVGYLKEKFDYLIDKYGVTLIYNPDYAKKNNFASLYHAREHLKNSYILVADDWIESNIFTAYEPDSWMSCVYFDHPANEWGVTIGSFNRITAINLSVDHGWALIGPAYFTREFSATYADLLDRYYHRLGTDECFWESIVRDHLKELPIHINRQDKDNVREFESVEDLRDYDPNYLFNSNNRSLGIISTVFGIPHSQIRAIRPLKDGMTNLSFLFEVNGETFVFRQPGVGTDKLIDRHSEKRTYELIEPLGIADEVRYFDGDSGVKISHYYKDSRIADPDNDDDVRTLMALLKTIHDAGIHPSHRFDIEERIDYYEQLAKGAGPITFTDYDDVRGKADELLELRRRLDIPEVLCHIDYVYSNILFLPSGEIRVIDWEYSGGADPLIDIAMFSIYALYTKEQIDQALRFYLLREPTTEEETRLYMYVALGGFLWSVWTEYKQGLGDEFGEYSLDMYRYMKVYHRLLKDRGVL